MLRKTTCSRKSAEIYCATAIFIEMYEVPLPSRILQVYEKGSVHRHSHTGFCKRGVYFEGDKGYNRGNNLNFTKRSDCMKLKHKFVIEILLVIVAIAVFVYNFSMQREIAYIASIVAVCGTIALLIKDIVKLRQNK